MKLLGIFLTACIVLAAAQAAAAVLMVLLLVGLVAALIFHPRETLGLIGFAIAAGLFEHQPLACLGFLAILAIAKLWKERR